MGFRDLDDSKSTWMSVFRFPHGKNGTKEIIQINSHWNFTKFLAGHTQSVESTQVLVRELGHYVLLFLLWPSVPLVLPHLQIVLNLSTGYYNLFSQEAPLGRYPIHFFPHSWQNGWEMDTEGNTVSRVSWSDEDDGTHPSHCGASPNPTPSL